MTVDQLFALRNAAAEMRDLQIEIENLEDRLQQSKRKLKLLQREQLPDMMDIAGVDQIGLPAADNLPAYDLILKPYIHANISAQWPPERQAEALQALTEAGHGSLIRTQIHIHLPRGYHDLVADMLNLLREKYNVSAEVRETVHSSTLTAFVKDAITNNQPLPPFEVIGADVGRIAQLKERK